MPNEVVMATSEASRPTAIRTRAHAKIQFRACHVDMHSAVPGPEEEISGAVELSEPEEALRGRYSASPTA